MEDKEAVKILTQMLQKHSFDEEETEALLTAIGLLGWTKLVEGRMKQIKKNRDRRNLAD